jgi:hypothetical protein
VKTTIVHGQHSLNGNGMRFWAFIGTKEYWVTKEHFDSLTLNALKNKRKRYSLNPEKFKKLSQIYKINNRDKILNSSKLNDLKRKNDPDRIAWKKRWRRNYLITNSSFHIACKLRTRIAVALKRQNAEKYSGLNDVLGCSWEHFIKHLESKFVFGMTWNNRPLWHIDHIKPCCSFDLTKPEEQRICFNYTNLQPLWAKDNLIKNGKH